MYLLCQFGAVVNFMSREDTGKSLWEGMVLLLSSRARGFSSIWFLQHRQLLQHQTPPCSVCNLSSPPFSAAEQQEYPTGSTFPLVGLYWNTFGNHQYILPWQERSSRGQISKKFHLCDTTIQFLCHSESHGHDLSSRIWMPTKGWEALFLELSKYRNNDFSFYLLYSISGLPNQALITLISSYNY